jgi:hypothetical protein
MTTELLDQILERLRSADPGKRQEIASDVERATADMPWVPNPGPQSAAYHCTADELFYGGQAGGGNLQSERHRADYLPPNKSIFSWDEAKTIVDQARRAVREIENLGDDDRIALATSLLFKGRPQ